MLQSMSRKANCYDNAPIESFFKTLKVEHIYQVRYEARAHARRTSSAVRRRTTEVRMSRKAAR
jgi:transposase InsO family protein